MSRVLELARPELRQLLPYIPGDYAPGTLRLNANESPWRTPGDTTARGLNRYPPPRPDALVESLGAYYGVPPDELLVTRGSSEAIDILIRGFCCAGRDSILICPPTFDMYRLYAEIQGAGVVRVPLLRGSTAAEEFAVDVDRVVGELDRGVKLVFICTPNNPTGSSIDQNAMLELCAESSGRAVIVIDEAYREFSERGDFRPIQEKYEHVILLRTLSKFVSLAGVRCGTVIARAPVISFLQGVLPPYTFPTPSIELVTQALAEDSLAVAEDRVSTIRRERTRLAEMLRALPEVERTWRSEANFILIKVRDADSFVDRARADGILVRVFKHDPALAGCIRITVGRPEDNDRLMAAVSK